MAPAPPAPAAVEVPVRAAQLDHIFGVLDVVVVWPPVWLLGRLTNILVMQTKKREHTNENIRRLNPLQSGIDEVKGCSFCSLAVPRQSELLRNTEDRHVDIQLRSNVRLAQRNCML